MLRSALVRLASAVLLLVCACALAGVHTRGEPAPAIVIESEVLSIESAFDYALNDDATALRKTLPAPATFDRHATALAEGKRVHAWVELDHLEAGGAPELQPEIAARRAWILALIGATHAAVEHADRALQTHPGLAEAHLARAWCLWRLARFDEADAQFQRAHAGAHPPPAWVDAEWSALHKKTAAARSELARLAPINFAEAFPDDWSPWFHYIRTFRAAGALHQAAWLCQLAEIRLGPPAEDLRPVLAREECAVLRALLGDTPREMGAENSWDILRFRTQSLAETVNTRETWEVHIEALTLLAPVSDFDFARFAAAESIAAAAKAGVPLEQLKPLQAVLRRPTVQLATAARAALREVEASSTWQDLLTNPEPESTIAEMATLNTRLTQQLAELSALRTRLALPATTPATQPERALLGGAERVKIHLAIRHDQGDEAWRLFGEHWASLSAYERERTETLNLRFLVRDAKAAAENRRLRGLLHSWTPERSATDSLFLSLHAVALDAHHRLVELHGDAYTTLRPLLTTNERLLVASLLHQHVVAAVGTRQPLAAGHALQQLNAWEAGYADASGLTTAVVAMPNAQPAFNDAENALAAAFRDGTADARTFTRLRALIAENPLRLEPRLLEMTGFWRVGRREEALNASDALRRDCADNAAIRKAIAEIRQALDPEAIADAVRADLQPLLARLRDATPLEATALADITRQANAALGKLESSVGEAIKTPSKLSAPARRAAADYLLVIVRTALRENRFGFASRQASRLADYEKGAAWDEARAALQSAPFTHDLVTPGLTALWDRIFAGTSLSAQETAQVLQPFLQENDSLSFLLIVAATNLGFGDYGLAARNLQTIRTAAFENPRILRQVEAVEAGLRQAQADERATEREIADTHRQIDVTQREIDSLIAELDRREASWNNAPQGFRDTWDRSKELAENDKMRERGRRLESDINAYNAHGKRLERQLVEQRQAAVRALAATLRPLQGRP